MGLLLAVALSLGSASLVAGAAPADAACYNHGCAGTNPQTQGCSSGAVNAGSKRFGVWGYNIGIVEARYSGACGSQWTRLRIEDIKLASLSMSLSHINVFGNGHNYVGAAAGSSPTTTHDPATWWSLQVGAVSNQYSHSGVVQVASNFYGITIGPV